MDCLKEVDIFRDLDEAERQTLFEGVTLRECPQGTLFFSPDESSESLFILKKGQVDIYRLTATGKRLVTRRVGPGTIFGEMGLLGQSMQGCFAEAAEDSLVCVATREHLLKLLMQYPHVALRVLEVVGQRLKLLEERLEQAVFSPVRARVAAFLLAHQDPSTGAVAGYTQSEIGDTIGALRQTVTEVLGEMQSQGLVEVGHKQVRILNAPALQGLVQPA